MNQFELAEADTAELLHRIARAEAVWYSEDHDQDAAVVAVLARALELAIFHHSGRNRLVDLRTVSPT